MSGYSVETRIQIAYEENQETGFAHLYEIEEYSQSALECETKG